MTRLRSRTRTRTARRPPGRFMRVRLQSRHMLRFLQWPASAVFSCASPGVFVRPRAWFFSPPVGVFEPRYSVSGHSKPVWTKKSDGATKFNYFHCLLGFVVFYFSFLFLSAFFVSCFSSGCFCYHVDGPVDGQVDEDV